MERAIESMKRISMNNTMWIMMGYDFWPGTEKTETRECIVNITGVNMVRINMGTLAQMDWRTWQTNILANIVSSENSTNTMLQGSPALSQTQRRQIMRTD